MADRSPTASAFSERSNLIGLGLGAVACAVFPTFIPIIAAAAFIGEAVYLAWAPRSSWYMARLSTRYDGEIMRRRAKIKSHVFTQIRPEVQGRFDHLEEERVAIRTQTASSEKWFLELLRKLDYLLDKFLEFANKEAEFRKYLRSVLEESMREESQPQAAGGFVKSHSGKRWPEEPPLDPAEVWVQAVVAKVQNHYDEETQDLNRQRVADTDDLTTNAVLDKRIDIIARRREYVGQIGKITINLNHQMQLIEETFGLINDEVRARTPEQILADVDEVIDRTDSLTEALQDFEPTALTEGPQTVSA